MNHATFFKLLLLIVAIGPLFGHAQALPGPGRDNPDAAQEVLHQADQAYAANRFDQALPLYQRLLEKDRLTSPRMLLRMALMEETTGKVPQTLYYLNLLYTLNPDDGVRTRMESLARQYQLEGYDMDEWDFFRKLLRRFSVHLFGVFSFFIALLVGLLWWRRYRGRPLRLLPLAIILLLVMASLALNLNVRYGKAIVISGKAALMTDASAASPLKSLIPAGTRLTVIGESDAWMRVVYRDKQGFVSRNVVWYF